MSRNGSGVYSLPAGNPVVTLTAISTSWANGTMSDIANELTNSLDKGGRTAPTANLPMAGFKHTGAGAAAAAGDYLVFGGAATLTDLTTTGNTLLGDATTDTFNQGAGSLVKNAAGNWTIAEPSSGDTFAAGTKGGNFTIKGILASNTLASSYSIGWDTPDALGRAAMVMTTTLSGAGSDSQLDFFTNQFGVSRASRLSILSTGFVGVGTTTPVRMLDVVGAVVADGALSSVARVQSTAAYNASPVAGISFANLFNSGGSAAGMGGIGVGKENTTDGDVAGYLALFTRPSAGSNTERLRITSDGRFYGTALHNNAGAVTGAVNQYIASGTYTPTLTNTTNISASTPGVCSWLRVGNVVTVSGIHSVTTSGAGLASLGISLPIASNLAALSDLAGGASATIPRVAQIYANTASDRAQLEFVETSGSTHDVTFTFTYVVL